MIPLKIQLKNFISYGPQVQTIDFEPYHLICLVGKNGHGKSALLDALTWALWGQARKSGTATKADEGLMRLGQSHMMVSLDFTAHGTAYRVRREYGVSSSKAIAQLDFGIIEPTSNQMRPLTDKTIRATQEKINQIIGLDYDSFINSAFIRQGQSNEFSKKSARDRKEILATILGLDRFEIMRKKATDKARVLMTEKDMVAQAIETCLKELEQKPVLINQLHDIENQLIGVKNKEQAISANLESLEPRRKELDTERQKYARSMILKEQLQSQRQQEAARFIAQVKQVRALVAKQKPNSQKGQQTRADLEQKVQSLQRHIEALPEKRTAAVALKQELQHLREKLIQEHSAILQALAKKMSAHESAISHVKENQELHRKKMTILDAEIQKIVRELHDVTVIVNGTEKLESIIETSEKLFERRKTFYQKYVAHGNFLKKEMDEYAQKQAQIQTASALCPLCEQELSDQLCTVLSTRFTQKNSVLFHQVQRLGQVLKRLKEILLAQHESLAALKQRFQDRTEALIKMKELHARHTEKLEQKKIESQALTQGEDLLKKYESEMIAHQKEAQQMASPEKRIVEDLDYQKKAQVCTGLEAAIAQLETFEKDYVNTTALLSQLGSKAHEDALVADRGMIQALKNEIHELNVLLKKITSQLNSIEKVSHTIDAIKKLEDSLLHKETELKKEMAAIHEHKEALMHRKGGLESHRQILEQKESATAAERERLLHLTESAMEYQAVAQALGKDGIQALLIDEAIPEIEYQANILLSKLTENQAHLTIESLRDLKSGATRETLDSKISDALGIRPYEMFSGGEAFRIDFALRIAISKLLARRAGATLQLLIIDEGFGSQDEEGLNQIMEALYKIQEDFSKIIIVSHLASMKDQFPVQFLVQKTPHGSTVRVFEQG